MSVRYNFRRKLKILYKEWQRNKITSEQVLTELKKYGLYARWIDDLRSILRTDIKSRALARMGRAALKQNAYLPLLDTYKAWMHRANGKTKLNDVSFIQIKCWDEIVTYKRTTEYFQVLKLKTGQYSARLLTIKADEEISREILNQRLE